MTDTLQAIALGQAHESIRSLDFKLQGANAELVHLRSLLSDVLGRETPRCDAVLSHEHGTTRCDKAPGHDDQHRGQCDACRDLAELEWDGEGGTSW